MSLISICLLCLIFIVPPIIMNSCVANHFKLILHLFSAVALGVGF